MTEEEKIEEEKIEEEEKFTVEMLPEILSDHDDEKYHIEIGLPGVKKENIELIMGGNHFCLKASKSDITYSACYALAHIIDASKATSKFDNGELVIIAPFVHPLKGIKITVE